MRLLHRRPDGRFAFHDCIGNDVPAYAILSHTWSTNDRDEVTFQDIESGTDHGKPGYKKIQFCADQAAKDGLQYFWVDTCNIDKRNFTELSEAINSMFRWYRKAARCYVYLSDVSVHDDQGQQSLPGLAWEQRFRSSRWFTRGWTLQELVAPTDVAFFSSEGECLGTKSSLQQMIHDITGIAGNALRGDELSDFSIEERMSWAKQRNTKLEEDHVYSLLGIFDVSMPVIYGEGKEKASRRLHEHIHKSYKGPHFEQFTVGLDLSTLPEAVQFVSREQELSEMHQHLYGHSTRSVVVLHGLGGMGKTQLAREYMRKHKEKYTAMFWLNANDDDSLKLSFQTVARMIRDSHPSASMLANLNLEGDLNQVVSAVKAWFSLRENSHWLVIYDNYDNPKTPGNTDRSAVDIRQYLPGADHGSIIITTRSAQVTQGRRIHIQKLPHVQERLEILSNASRRQGIESDPVAIELVEQLDGLPLALSTAGAYLENVTTSFSEYLQLYNASWLKLQQTTPQLPSYEDRALYTTWQVTLDRIEQQNPASAKLLKLWAYFDRQDLWFELLRHASSTDDESIRKLTEDKLSFDEAVRLLCSYGLVDQDFTFQEQYGSSRYSVHSCVHMWSVCVLNREWEESLARLALTCIASEIPLRNEKNSWLLQQRLLPHVMIYQQLIEDGKIEIKGMEWELNSFGNLYDDQCKLDKAEQMYLRALQGKEEALGPAHPSTLETVHNLGILYRDQGKLDKAEQMYLQALQGKEEALGPAHSSTLDTVNSLGLLYGDQGKLDKAEQMYLRALQGKEEALGPAHPSTLDTIYNLGLLYWNQGKLDKAEQMYLQALQGYTEALGPAHPSTLDTVHSLGILYRDRGKLDKAEQMYLQVLQGYEKALGPAHSSTLDAVNSLGLLYRDQCKLDKAEQMFIQALQGKEEALGPAHPSTLDTIYNLGLLYRDQGKLDKAGRMYLQALQGYKEALGPAHSSTLDIVHSLGILYRDQGKLDKAGQMYLKALQGYTKALGPAHPSTFNVVNSLGLLYWNQGKLDKAEQMYLRALHGKEEALGPAHSSTLDTVYNLGLLYRDQGKLDKAEQMYLQALQGYTEALGPAHPSTLDTIYNLGILSRDQGKLDKAEQMYLRALQGKEEALGPAHPSTLDTIYNLGLLSRDQGKLDKAEQMYLQALQGYTEALGPAHPSTLDIFNSLGLLYMDQGKLDKAGQMFIQALQGKEDALGPAHPSTLDTIYNLGILYMDQGKLDKAGQMYLQALQGYEEALGPAHPSTLDTIYNLGILYRDQGKLDKAEQMFIQALQGYTKAFGNHNYSWTPVLDTMSGLATLFSKTNREDMAKEMYTKALSRFAAIEGPSSEVCQELERKMEKLGIALSENADTSTGA